MRPQDVRESGATPANGSRRPPDVMFELGDQIDGPSKLRRTDHSLVESKLVNLVFHQYHPNLHEKVADRPAQVKRQSRAPAIGAGTPLRLHVLHDERFGHKTHNSRSADVSSRRPSHSESFQMSKV